MEDLSRGDASPRRDNLLAFVQRRQLDTYATLDRLKEMFEPVDGHGGEEHILDEQLSPPRSLTPKLKVIARLIAKGLGTRVFYISLDGFDTHAGQREPHAALLGELADGIATFFDELQKRGHDKRVLVMTFSEFGRRVKENGSGGTDHGAASCLFVAGPAVRPGPVGLHPSLKDLDSGDLKYHTDFRRVYATLLDRWLSCDSQLVLGGKFGNLELLKSKA